MLKRVIACNQCEAEADPDGPWMSDTSRGVRWMSLGFFGEDEELQVHICSYYCLSEFGARKLNASGKYSIANLLR